jgi:hypothetical protein
MPTVLDVFTWLEATPLGVALRDSFWLFPVVESFHLLGLAVIGGAVLMVDLRMLGYGLKRTPLAELTRDTRPFLLGSLVLMLISGFALFTSEATKCYYHDAFWVKMGSLALAILFYFTIQTKIAMADEKKTSPIVMKLVAIVSLLLWTGVGIGGRWIGFS